MGEQLPFHHHVGVLEPFTTHFLITNTMDITPTPVSGGFYSSTTGSTSSRPLIENTEDDKQESLFTMVTKTSLMVEVEPAPISCGHVVSAITQLPPALIQNCDDYLAALSQLSMEEGQIVWRQGICSTAPKKSFLKSQQLPMVLGPLHQHINGGSSSSNTIPPKQGSQRDHHSSSAAIVVPTCFSSNLYVDKQTNQGYPPETPALQQSQISSTYGSSMAMVSSASPTKTNYPASLQFYRY